MVTSGLLIGGTVPAVAAPTVDAAVAFTDVPSGMMFAHEMSWLGNEGISSGWGDGTYRPLQEINRDAMAAFIYRMAGSPEYTAPSTSPFRDVSTTQEHYKEMTWLYQEGISTGWADGVGKPSYRPLSPINRDAMAAFLFRFKGDAAYQAPAASPFADTNAAAAFYREISWLHSSGIATGWDNGDGSASYRPLTPINRDAMAAYLYRLSLPPVDEGMVLAVETIVVDGAAHVHGYEPGSPAITIDSVGSGAPDVDPGDVLVSDFSETTPHGMLVRVQQVTTGDDGLQVALVEQATLPDAIYSTNGLQSLETIVVAQEFIPAEGVELLDTTPEPMSGELGSGATVRDLDARAGQLSSPGLAGKAAVTVPLFEKAFKFSDTLTRTTSGTAWKAVDVEGTGSLSLSGEVGIETAVNVELDIAAFSLKEANFTLDTELYAKTAAGASGQLIGTAERNLGTVETWVKIATPIPIAIELSASVDLKAQSEWNADTRVTAEASSKTSAGMRYKDGGFETVFSNDGEADASFKGPQLTSESLVSVGPTLAAKLYGMAGLTGGFDAYASYITGPDTCAHEVGLDGRFGVVAGIEVLGMELTDEWKKELSKKLVLWDGDLCAAIEAPPVDEVTEEVFGDGIAVSRDGGSGDSTQWGRADDYGPGGAAWILSTGIMQDSIGPSVNHASTDLSAPGNATLSGFIDGATTYDAASYWAEIVPTGDTLHVSYFFASEEYPDYVGSRYNDVMGVFVDGKNCATVPGTTLPVAVNNVNGVTNPQYFIDNTQGQSGFNSAMGGMTTRLTCSVPVQPGTPVRIEIAIADTGDSFYDSAIALLDRGIWSD